MSIFPVNRQSPNDPEVKNLAIRAMIEAGKIFSIAPHSILGHNQAQNISRARAIVARYMEDHTHLTRTAIASLLNRKGRVYLWQTDNRFESDPVLLSAYETLCTRMDAETDRDWLGGIRTRTAALREMDLPYEAAELVDEIEGLAVMASLKEMRSARLHNP